MTEGEGLPVTVRRVEDVGRHRIVRAELYGQRLDVIVGEDASLPAGPPRIAFEPGRINVYVDDWRLAGSAG
jgi:glycerol transport system ATP-binding protein